MTALRILNLIVWLGLLIYMLPGAYNAVFGKQLRRGDPMRLAVLATAFVIIGFNLRWLLAPDNFDLWRALYVLSAVLGVYIARLAYAYGRGPNV